MLLPRLAEPTGRAALDRQAAVALIGPRQVGKTTLARGIGDQRGAQYLDLESREERDKLASPRLYLERFADRLVILDEIHRMPELFQTLLGIADLDRLAGHPVVGSSWEGFVIENPISALPDRTQPLFYRTAAGAEIDLLLERPDGALWAIEIKRGLAAKPRRGFYGACEDLKPTRAFVVYAGEERYPVAEGIEAIEVREMARLVAGG